MSFFGKLRDRLFKSSKKLEEGLDAIVEEGGELDEAVDPDTQAEAEEQARQEAEAASLIEQEAAREREKAEREAEEDAARTAAEAARRAAELAARERQDAQRQAQEQAAARAEADRQAQAEAARTAAEAERRAAELAAARAAEEETRRQAEAARKAEEQARLAEQDERRRQAEAQARAEAEAAARDAAEPAAQEQPRPGLIGRILGRGRGAPVMRRALDDDMLEQLEELLITSDMGVDTALRVVANIAEGRMGRKVSTAELKGWLADEIARIMEPVARPLPLYPKKPQVVLVVGVNGSGKTTTIGKLASQFRAAGKSVMIAAGDTFRAAAVEQLQIWGDRAGVPVLTAPEGSDPASLAFDAMDRAEAEGADLLMIDTAGRLQNRQDLMEELAKIVRVIRRKDDTAPHNTLLVLDATTGQNALQQVKIFQELADVSGLVMTKLDGTAKGGVLVALADRFGLPIHAIGVGEKIDDLDAFDAREFALALTGATE